MSDFSTMEYTELQDKAKELGLPSHRVAKEDLIKSLEEATTKNEDASKTDKVEPEKETPKVETEEAPKEKAFDTVNVYGASRAHFIRAFTLKIHGKDFVKLAEQFANKYGYTTEKKFVGEPLVCKNCGHEMIEEE